MEQTFVLFSLSNPGLVQSVTAELTRKGYAVNDPKRLVANVVQIRVRQGTRDEAEVEQLVMSRDPKATRLPGATPTMNLVGYRDSQS